MRFIETLADATTVLGTYPLVGSPRLAADIGIAEVRTLALRRFPYVLVYSDDADAVRVHRVLHTARDIPAELLEL